MEGRLLNNVLIFVEKNDGKKLNLNKIFKEIKMKKDNLSIYLIFFGESDGKIINKKISKYPLIKKINIEQVSIAYEKENFIAEKAFKKVEYFISKVNTDNKFDDYFKSVQGVLFNKVFISLIIKEKISKIIEEFQPVLSILIGKWNSNPYYEEAFKFPNYLSYSLTFSEWIKIITREQDIPLKIYKTDSLYLKKVTSLFRKTIFAIGFLKKKLGYRILIPKIYNSYSTDNKLILLRGIAHVKLASRFMKEKNNNTIVIYDSKKISKSQINDYFSIDENKYKTTILLSKYFWCILNYSPKILKDIFVMKKKLKEFNIEPSDIMIIPTLIMTEIIKLRKFIDGKNINSFLTFEESNLFGAIFSQAIVPEVNNSTCVQHGFTVSFYQTMPLLSQKRWVWGSYFKDEYILKGESPEKIEIKGKEFLDIKSYEELKKGELLTILLAPAYKSNINEVIYWIHTVVNSLEGLNCKKIKISFHPNQPQINKFKKIREFFNKKIEIIIGCSNEDIQSSNLIISGNTTVGFEAALLGKNTFLYLLKNDEIIYNYAFHPFIEVINEGNDFLSRYNNIDMKLKKKQHLNFLKEYAGLFKYDS